jgi:hypothetical protein
VRDPLIEGRGVRHAGVHLTLLAYDSLLVEHLWVHAHLARLHVLLSIILILILSSLLELGVSHDLHLLSELNVWIRLLEVERVLATWLVLWVSLVNLSVWAHFFLLLHGGALR